MIRMEDLRDRIAWSIEHGATLPEVQDELIEPAEDLSEDERSGLWLFAWSYTESVSRAPRRSLVTSSR
jgi:hypothetical protein